MNLQLPPHWRVYFALRKWAIRLTRGAIVVTRFTHWYWAAFHLMSFQRWMRWNFEVRKFK